MLKNIYFALVIVQILAVIIAIGSFIDLSNCQSYSNEMIFFGKQWILSSIVFVLVYLINRRIRKYATKNKLWS